MIGLMTPIWRRPELTRIFLDYYTQMDLPEGIVHVCVLSPEDKENRDLPSLYPGVRFVSAPNAPLSDKHNVGMLALRELQPDTVVLLPSDDFFTPEYVSWMDTLNVEYGADSARTTSLWFYDMPTGRMMYRRKLRIGAGHMFSRGILDRMDWRPWPSGKHETSMDGLMFERMTPYLGREVILHDLASTPLAGVDVKGDVSRNGFDKLWKAWASGQNEFTTVYRSPSESAPFWRRHFPAIADRFEYVRDTEGSAAVSR